jgi:hypothetical protein
MEACSPVLPSSPSIPETLLALDQPEYNPLPVAHVIYRDGVRSMISCYRLTIRERLKILFSGRLWWEQLTFGGPLQPQKLYLREPLKDAWKDFDY